MKVFSMSNAIDRLPSEVHIVPIGEWKERGFRITEEDCDDIIRNFESFGIKLVVDYNHQSLNHVGNGKPAPAAGWIGRLEKRENGVWASQIEWTEEAKQFIENKQFRYISPVIYFDDHDPHTDSWIGCTLHSVALTNTPYFNNDLEPLINNRNGKPKNNDPAPKSAKETDMTLEEQVAALSKENAAQKTELEALKTQIAERDAKLADNEQDKMVDEAISAKKLLPSQKEVARIVAKSGKEAFDKFIAANVLPDITNAGKVPEAGGKDEDSRAEYAKLLKDPKAFSDLKEKDPQRFESLRKAYFGG